MRPLRLSSMPRLEAPTVMENIVSGSVLEKCYGVIDSGATAGSRDGQEP